MRDHLREPGSWQIYVPLAQFPSSTLAFVVRSSADPTLSPFSLTACNERCLTTPKLRLWDAAEWVTRCA